MHIMVDISDDTQIVRRHAEVTGVVRRRRWSDEEKGRIVAEAIAPGAVIADVARQHDLARQHLSNWIRAAKDGQFALPADEMPAFVPVVSVKSARANKAAHERRSATIEIVIGAIKVRVPGGPRRETSKRCCARFGAPAHERRNADSAGADPGSGGDEAGGLPQRDGRACGAGEGAIEGRSVLGRDLLFPLEACRQSQVDLLGRHRLVSAVCSPRDWKAASSAGRASRTA